MQEESRLRTSYTVSPSVDHGSYLLILTPTIRALWERGAMLAICLSVGLLLSFTVILILGGIVVTAHTDDLGLLAWVFNYVIFCFLGHFFALVVVVGAGDAAFGYLALSHYGIDGSRTSIGVASSEQPPLQASDARRYWSYRSTSRPMQSREAASERWVPSSSSPTSSTAVAGNPVRGVPVPNAMEVHAETATELAQLGMTPRAAIAYAHGLVAGASRVLAATELRDVRSDLSRDMVIRY